MSTQSLYVIVTIISYCRASVHIVFSCCFYLSVGVTMMQNHDGKQKPDNHRYIHDRQTFFIRNWLTWNQFSFSNREWPMVCSGIGMPKLSAMVAPIMAKVSCSSSWPVAISSSPSSSRITVPLALLLPMILRPVRCSSSAISSGGNPVSVKVWNGSVRSYR